MGMFIKTFFCNIQLLMFQKWFVHFMAFRQKQSDHQYKFKYVLFKSALTCGFLLNTYILYIFLNVYFVFYLNKDIK